jgi:hypothetical protein
MSLKTYNKYFTQNFLVTYNCIYNGKLECGTGIKKLDVATIKKLAKNQTKEVPWFENDE